MVDYLYLDGMQTFVDPPKQVLMTIWLLGNQDSFRLVLYCSDRIN